MTAVGRRLDIAKQHATDVTATLNAEVTIQNMNNHEQSNTFSGTTGANAISREKSVSIGQTNILMKGNALYKEYVAISKNASDAQLLVIQNQHSDGICFDESGDFFNVKILSQANDLAESNGSYFERSSVTSVELLVFPCLPDEGVGGATKLRRLKRRSEDTELYDVDRAEKLKSIAQDEFVSRQEKDFLSIMMKEMLEFRKNVSISSKSGESPQEAMASYKNLLSQPSDEGQGSHFHLELVKAVCTEIQKVGDQGSSIEDVYSLVRMPGEQAPEIFILALQEFGRDQIVYYSVMIKAADNLDQETYGMKLHGHTKLGEGKHKNQNHALVITRGEAFQTVDTIQENCMK
ncbi:hypothetical protein Gohar_009553 [Gossypium harknessii]|uniref:Glycosyl transferase 48 domain-containing protein n=1 Tax=Gossypium harknessii TaxID=34285 RepID=A0A7J9GN71_9ROSI|nr:hypothetical protein [Gossypium harknessii]